MVVAPSTRINAGLHRPACVIRKFFDRCRGGLCRHGSFISFLPITHTFLEVSMRIVTTVDLCPVSATCPAGGFG